MCVRQEIKDGKIKCLKKYIKLLDIKTKSEHINMGSSVLYLTKDLLDMDQLNYLQKNLKKIKNVNVLIENMGKKVGVLEEYVIDITKTGDDMEMLCTQIKKEMKWGQEGIKRELMVKIDTGELWKIKLEENLKGIKLFIMLILLKLIMTLEIYTVVKQEANIYFCIDNLKISQGSYIELGLSNLRMENIILNSDAQRYKMLGNGWTVDVIAHILKNIKGKV